MSRFFVLCAVGTCADVTEARVDITRGGLVEEKKKPLEGNCTLAILSHD